MDQKFVIAYDLGTSSVKGALVTMQGELSATAIAPYPLLIPRENWAEQDPEDYWRGVCEVTGKVLAQTGTAPEQVQGIAFGTMWRGIIPVDKQGNVLHNNILWLDQRAVEQAQRLSEHFHRGRFPPGAYWPKLLWLRENRPEIVEQADIILEVNSYLKWKATGQAAVDISNNFAKSVDPVRDAWYEELFSYIGIPREKFPKVVHASDLTGRLTAGAARELGLAEGTPVFAGNNDIQAVAVGAGCSSIGDAHVYFGSSGWIGCTVEHEPGSGAGSPFDEQRDIALSGMKALGLSLNWGVDTFYAAEKAQDEAHIFDLINRDVAQIPPGAEGVLATPWFYGEDGKGFDPKARAQGCFLNLNSRHDRRHMMRAIMEGICYHLKMRLGDLRESGRTLPESLRTIGGGACSEVWMQMLADILEMPVEVPCSARHIGALGTAQHALIGLGVYADYEDAAKRVHIEHRFLPREEVRAVYRKNYAVYEQIYTALKPIFYQLNPEGEHEQSK